LRLLPKELSYLFRHLFLRHWPPQVEASAVALSYPPTTHHSGNDYFLQGVQLDIFRAVVHKPWAHPQIMKRWQILMVRKTHPTQAGTEARPTNLKLET
jgi:hypothetical protein